MTRLQCLRDKLSETIHNILVLQANTFFIYAVLIIMHANNFHNYYFQVIPFHSFIIVPVSMSQKHRILTLIDFGLTRALQIVNQTKRNFYSIDCASEHSEPPCLPSPELRERRAYTRYSVVREASCFLILIEL